MEKRELAGDRHEQEAVGLGDRARNLGQVLRPGDADRDRQPDPLPDLAPEPDGDLSRRPGDAAKTPDVEKASSIESPSTSGVVSSKTLYSALLASVYAAMRGRTTMAAGHSRRARATLIAVCTPWAFAS